MMIETFSRGLLLLEKYASLISVSAQRNCYNTNLQPANLLTGL